MAMARLHLHCQSDRILIVGMRNDHMWTDQKRGNVLVVCSPLFSPFSLDTRSFGKVKMFDGSSS